MLNVPSRLLEPLSIDTDITYDLDMSKFPGLDDPQQMYQPALFIATEWSDYVYHDAQSVTHGTDDTTSLYNSDDVCVDDLYFLIESSQEFITDVISSNLMDDHIFQSLVDDVIADSDVIIDIIDSATPSLLTEPLHYTWDSFGDAHICTEDTEKLTSDGEDVTTKEQRSPFVSCIRGHKRRRNDEFESVLGNKKSKRAEISSLQIPTMVSVFSRSNVCELVRNS